MRNAFATVRGTSRYSSPCARYGTVRIAPSSQYRRNSNGVQLDSAPRNIAKLETAYSSSAIAHIACAGCPGWIAPRINTEAKASETSAASSGKIHTSGRRLFGCGVLAGLFLAERAAEHLARGMPGQLGHDLDLLRDLEARERCTDVLHDRLRRELGPGTDHDERLDRLAGPRVRHADHHGLLDL